MPLKKIREHIQKLRKKDWRKDSRGMIFSNELKNFQKSFRENFVVLMISSLGLLVALGWNNLWNAWISTLSVENTVPYKFYLALGTTIFAVIMTYFLSKLKN